MNRGRHVEFFHFCRCGCREIIPISQRYHSLEEEWQQMVRGVVVAVDVPRPTATPARVVRHGLGVDGDQGAPEHTRALITGPCADPSNPSTQAAGAP